MPSWRRRAALVATAALLVLAGASGAAETRPDNAAAPRGFVQIQQGPNGGSVWQGFVRDSAVPGQRRPDVVYLPPGAKAHNRYPVIYLLHGLPGSPWELAYGLHFAATADRLIASRRVRPFIAVMPPAGATVRFYGEWTGVWEGELVSLVAPWAERSLPVSRAMSDTAIAGLSAGGYGAIDIGLRHPRLAHTLESWSGYYRAPRDGTLAGADAAERSAHDPTLLVRDEQRLLRRLGTRIYLSSGSTHDRVTTTRTQRFAQVLASAGIPHHVVLRPGGHDGGFWRRQLADALVYAFGVSVPRASPGSTVPASGAGRS